MPTNRKPISRKQAREIDSESPYDDPAVQDEEDEVEEPRSRRRPAYKGVVKHQSRQKPRVNKRDSSEDGSHVSLPWNDVTISGFTNFVQDMKVTDDGTPYFNFSVSVSQGKGKRPCYMNVTMWGDVAEDAEKDIVDGMRVIVKGRLTQRKWEGVNYTGIRGDYYELIEEE